MSKKRPLIRQNMRHQFFIYSLIISLSAIFPISGCGKKEQSVPTALPEVLVTTVIQQDVPIYKEFVGQTEGFKDIQIRARVEGYLQSVNFKEGSFVKAGELLYQIDSKPFEAALAKADAELATAEARFAKMKLDVDRLRPLAEQKAISQQEFDNASAGYDAAKAQVDVMKASREQAALNLSYTKITSPIDGLIDVTKAKPGDLVGRGENTLLTTISQTDPIMVRVSLSETEYLTLSKQRVEREAAGEQKSKFPIQLILADNSIHTHPGKIEYADRAVNSNTGTLTVSISFPNSDKILRPGQYAKTRGVIDVKKNALLVPQRAVREIQGINSVAVVDAANKVLFRNVTVGNQIGQSWIIRDGLAAGEKVIAEGIQKVKDGMTVSPKDTAMDSQPAESPAQTK